MNYPTWLGVIGKKEEMLRASSGLMPKKDGWYKTVLGKKRYIARPMPLADVLKILPARIDELHGRATERPAALAINSTTIDGLAEMYLAHLWQRHTTGSPRKLTRRTYDDYLRVLEKFCEAVGPRQPAIAAGPTWFTRFMRTLAGKAETTKQREIIYITAFFNWAGPGRHALNFYKTEVQFGPDFRKPDQAKLREARGEYSTAYTRDQFHAALFAVAPSPLLYAMGLLAFNCAFLPVDLTSIPLTAIDLETGLYEFPRGKNGIPRKGVLMPETIEAVRRYLVDRPVGDDVDEALFVREDGKAWNIRDGAGSDTTSNHGNTLAVYWSDITGHPLKGLRTTFATEADGEIDQVAVDLVMGHAAKTVRSKFYVKSFEPERLRTVISHVWQRVGPQEPLPAVASISPGALARRAAERSAAASKRRSLQAESDTGSASTSARSRRARPARQPQ